MRSLNLDQLRALVEVVELGSFSAAARRLHLSQPAVSLQIRELEGRLGVQLVERLGKRAFATAAGSELIDHARRIETAADRALAAMRRYKEGWLGRVRIGASATLLTYLLPSVIKALRDEHPNIDLVIATGTTTSLVEQLVHNTIDLGLVSLPVDERRVDVMRLRDEELVALLPAGATPIPPEITPSELLRYPLIFEEPGANLTRLVLDWLETGGELPRPVMELANVEAIKQSVAAGLGASVVPGVAVTGGTIVGAVVVRPLRPRLFRTIGLVQRRDKPDEPALRYVRQALRTLANVPTG